MEELQRVCVISDGGSDFVVPAESWTDHIAEINDFEEDEEYTYTLTFKWIKKAEAHSLPEFGGF